METLNQFRPYAIHVQTYSPYVCITLELELSEGDNFIYVTKDSEYYFQLDYIDLTYIG